jgi:hypothetical protein
MANTDLLAEICTAETALQTARDRRDRAAVARLEATVAGLWRRRREDLAQHAAHTHQQPADAWAQRRARR